MLSFPCGMENFGLAGSRKVLEMIETGKETAATGLEIAVIGMAGRFPGAGTIDEFRENLEKGVESISFFSESELAEAGVDGGLLKNPGYVKAGSFLEGTEYFDSAFFNYTPVEASSMDPQLRIYHECAWAALEDAGYDPGNYPGLIGVYSGASPDISWVMEAMSQTGTPSREFDIFNLNSGFSFGTRIAYQLDLKGPGVTVQTACSSSLAAIHLACQSLLNAECDIALAGGVSVTPGGKPGYLFQAGMIGSPDGHCRAFDARAAGTIPGEGVGMVTLKRLEEAREEGDNIYAVVKGTAMNNDGSRKIGYTSPSVDGQGEVIRAALEAAEVEPESISYIETHGTGTALGDPIEIEGLKMVFKHSCALGSVKTNIGHLDNAAGVCGFIKTVLSLKHRVLLPTLHVETPNPEIDFETTPFYINTQLKEWKSNDYPLRAGVSSFGIGGTNVHAVLEEAPAGRRRARGRHQLIPLSAKTQSALEKMTGNLADYLQRNPGISLPDAAYTLQTGRKTFKYRGMSVCSTIEEAVENHMQILSSVEENRPVVFMFPGQGSQYVNMGWELYQNLPLFRREMDRCFEILKPLMDFDIKEIVYPSLMSNKSNMPYMSDINRTDIAQPVLFVFEYSLAKLLMTWGIDPCAMTGHSIGEYAAACLAGVFSPEDALTLVALRGKLMQQMPPGAMLAVSMAEKELTPLLGEELSIAAVNGPANCVVSGTCEAIDAFARQLKERGCQYRPLHTSHAFHSKMMEPVLKEFEQKVKGISLNKPRKPYLSNLSGTWITEGEAVDPGYWAVHLRNTVRFHQGLTELLKKEENALSVEVGPGRVLTALARRHPGKNNRHSFISLVRHPKEAVEDERFLLSKIGRLWQEGVKIDWTGFYKEEKEERQRIPLPTYPFEKQYVGVKHKQRSYSKGKGPNLEMGKNSDISQWFYTPSWQGVHLPLFPGREVRVTGSGCWLVFTDACGLGSVLSRRLEKDSQTVIRVRQGPGFKREKENAFIIDQRKEEDYDTLFKELNARFPKFDRIVHLWSVSEGEEVGGPALEQVDRVLDSGYYSLLYIVRAMGRQKIDKPVQMDVVSTQLQGVVGDEALCAAKTALLGPVKVIPREYSHISCRSIDIPLPRSGNREQLVDTLLLELTAGDDPIVALRGGRRWTPGVEKLPMDETGTPGQTPPLKKQGVYLVTGGLGGIGLVLAEELAVKWQARLVLTGRSGFPPPEEWPQYLNACDPGDPVGLKIRRLQSMEKKGAEIMVCKADTADLEQMRAVIRQAEERFGPVNGIIHSAGLPDGGIIQRRTRRQSREVLAPKVKGTLVLDTLFQTGVLDFFLLCSSLSSILAPPGQVAYCAANNFLDTFALSRRSRSTFTLSVAWDAWQEVGMAVAAVEQATGTKKETLSHPLLDYCIRERPGRETYISHFSTDRHWVFNEHRVRGKATLPGTAYLEMAGAAFEHQTGGNEFEIRELYLLTPLTLEEGEQKIVHTILEKQNEKNRFTFSIESQWQEHARGIIMPLQGDTPEELALDPGAIQAQCRGDGSETQDGNQGEFISAGPRWDNLIRVQYGGHHGLAELEVPQSFVADLEGYRLHPALMDRATAFLLGKYHDKKFYLPFLFKGVKVMGPLPRKVYSHARAVEKDKQKQGLEFDITIMNEQGVPRVEIEGFTVMAVTGETSVSGGIERKANVKTKEEGPLKDGILPAEGVEVFNRLLRGAPPQVLISTVDFHERLRYPVPPETLEEPVQTQTRPELSTGYSAPADRTQQTLANIWQQFLGIRQVGILDNFFELGGDSLKGLTVISEVHKTLNVELSVTDLFAAPTIRELAETIDKVGESVYSSITPVEKREYYPLSSAQKRLYFLQQMQPQSVFYNIPNMMKVEGALDKGRFEDVFFVLIQRHESLRTTFHQVGKEPVQKIHHHSHVDFCITYDDLSRGSMPDTGGIIANFIRPFDLSRLPLVRVKIVKIDRKKYLWLFDIHHIAADATGLAILHKDLFKLYRREESSPLKIQYKDFSGWMNRRSESGELKEQEEYWLNVFSDGVPPVNLPADFPRPDMLKFEGALYEFKLAKEETLKFSELGAGVGATLFINILTALNVIIFKYTGQEDIVLGSSIVGRPHADLWEIVGMFVNMLAMRNFPGPQLTYVDFLRQVKATALGAFENQDMQFERLVERLNLEGETSHNPIFNICLNMENYEQPKWEVEGLSVTPCEFQYGNARFDMLLWANHVEEEIRFMLEYSTELFKPSTAREFCAHFIEILEQVAVNKEIRLEDIKLSQKVINPQSTVPQIEFKF